MLNIPRSQSTAIKHMIYPDQAKVNPKFHKNNLVSIKMKQEENRQKKEYEENHIPRIFLVK
jgi:hypothetical protein